MPMPSILRPLPRLLVCLASALALPAGAQDHAALGSAALAKADYRGAAEHLEAASRELEGGDRERLSQVQIDLGLAYLIGLGRPADALRAFVRAADLAANPATAWLWASASARELGEVQESERYRRLALGRRSAAEPAGAAVEVEAPWAASTAKDLKDGKDGKDEKAKPEVAPPAKPEAAPSAKPEVAPLAKPEVVPPAKPEPAPEPGPSGNAFDHFFKRKPEGEAPQAPPPAEPPPA